MSVDFIGMIQSQKQSEIHPPDPNGPVIDRDYVRAFAQAHEQAGFDRILVPHHSTGPSATLTISYAAALTERIHFMLAHRPGFTNPTLAARQIATLDQFTGGRLGVHFISGGSDSEQRRDGDYLDHDQRYARTDEYLGILRRIWTESKPFDHEGAFYRFEQGFSEVKPAQKPHVPIYFGGASDVAVEVAGKHADVYALWGESLDQVRDLTTRVRAEAAKHGRSIRFSVSFRPILAETEDAAWARAESILERTRALRVQQGYSRGGPQQSEGARRLLAAAEQGERVDKRLWTAIAKETGGRSNSTSLVGTPEQVADALLDYYDLGVTTFLIRGFDPLEDVVDYGRTLIPRVRELVAQREAQRKAA
ncbi:MULTISPECIES: LLM class flavin-dependent oxidoreductase [Ralstonia]|jgi:alkanesulfonate monooxygenase|uniref:Flavin-dependent oxidoreductase, methylene-tetrahydromethanopterin reductase n=1 Tax=Ralstonia pickettii OR214 TaxID=1264675 RepID=R0E174_RALPI|nr:MULTISPECIES: LLM class flavin-dependent oxidoreductase [Ralstonia]MEA3269493.1 LLM class flavin-dependent oxidoreductase [Pseudomonadota bacterium]ENZ75919.1 flavin-dependent oxidoreductase, methylene-tetrahydromethanopterin reductase [Ralstonia pickettii OR214]MBL4779484.1 LLM class flavin-dependent oxidoreductase [Ralstonia sp.]MCM3583040.1 LLM class flavin-dependent oxidoreductase [Ralstonia pickettii]MDR9387262.1 LLM class flavin-dependent oxidoreductase [Ralstonia sp. 11b]